MSDRVVMLQYVINQRTEIPKGIRIWSDGSVEKPAPTNALPSATERLDLPRELQWETIQTLDGSQLDGLRQTVRESKFFSLEPRLLINYCKEDPGTAIWIIDLDGKRAQVVVFDPRPRRDATIDALLAAINAVLA